MHNPAPLVIIYPSNTFTNFETSRLIVLRQVAKEIGRPIFEIPLLINSNDDILVCDRITEISALNPIIHILWIRSSMLLVSQINVAKQCSEQGITAYNYLSLGDEYNVGDSDILNSLLFYEKIIIYNNDKFKKLTNKTNDFLFWSLAPKTNNESWKAISRNIVAFVGTGYKVRKQLLNGLAIQYPHMKFIVGGSGWGDFKPLENMKNLGFLDNSKYSKVLGTSAFNLILNKDNSHIFHKTSKLVDCIESGSIPIWEKGDPELNWEGINLSCERLYIDHNLEIHPKNLFERLQNDQIYFSEYLKVLKQEFVFGSECEKQISKFIEDLNDCETTKPRAVDFCRSLKIKGVKYSFLNKKNVNIHIPGKNVICIPIRLAGIRLPPSFISAYVIFPINDVIDANSSKLLISGLDLAIFWKNNKIVKGFKDFILRRFYRWV